MGTRTRFAALGVLILLAFAAAAPLAADTRTENIDVIVALDRSLSMEKKVDAVKNYVTTYLVDQVLIPGDHFIVVAFYGKTDLLISQTIAGEADKAAVNQTIAKIRGNGRFTDIGNALDVLQEKVAPLEKNGRKKFILLLTDGIQEAPPTSKYYSRDGSFNHAFLLNTKTIQKKGWKIQILGIGTDTAAKDLARELEGTYNEISDTLSLDTMLESTQGLFGRIRIAGSPLVAPVSADGASTIAVTLAAEGYKVNPSVTIETMTARFGEAAAVSILSAPFAFSVRASGTTRLSIPVRFPSGLPAGSLLSTLGFTFAAGERFTPSEISTTIRVKGWIGNNLLVVVLAAAGLVVVLVLVALLIVRLARGKPIGFTLLDDGEPVSPGTTALTVGAELFMNEADGVFSLVRKRNARSVARIRGKRLALGMEVLKADRFPKLGDVPPDVRGKSFVVRRENGEKTTVKFVSKEKAK